MNIKKSNEIVVCLLGAGFTTGNMGVAALAGGTIASFYHCFPEKGRMFLCDYNKISITYHVPYLKNNATIDLVNIRYTKKIFLPNSIVRLLLTASIMYLSRNEKVKKTIIEKNKYLKRLYESTFVISISGGDSFSDIYGIKRLFYVALPQLLAILMKKPLIQMPQTHGPFESKISKYIASYILKKSSIVFARDTESLLLINKILRLKTGMKPDFAFDMGFALPAVPPRKKTCDYLDNIKKRGTLVGLNISGLLYMGGYTKSNMFGLKSNYSELVEDIIINLFETFNINLLLIPHVFGKGRNSESDTVAIEKIFNRISPNHKDSLHKLTGTFDQYQLKYIIGRCDFFLGSRMHACIAAISQEIPTVGLAYSRKFKGVFESVSKNIPIADLKENDQRQVVALIDNSFLRKEKIRDELRVTIPYVNSQAKNFFNKLNLQR